MPANSTTAPAAPSRNSAGEPPPSPRHHEAVDAVTAQAVRERLLARDHVVLQRSDLKQPARDFMTLAHVGRMLSRCPDRSVAGKSVEDQTWRRTGVDSDEGIVGRVLPHTRGKTSPAVIRVGRGRLRNGCVIRRDGCG